MSPDQTGRRVEPRLGALVHHMDHAMLDVRPIANRFVVFDTEFNEPVMRFDNRPDADAFLAEMTIAECYVLLESWAAPEKPAQAA